jgi:hypothetical protein
VEFRTWCTGPETVEVRDPLRAYPPLELGLVLPVRPGVVDLGDVVVGGPEDSGEAPEERTIRLLDAAGRPLPLDRFEAWLRGPEEEGSCVWRLDGATGRVVFRTEWGRQRLQLSGPGWLPFDVVLSDWTPAEMRRPGGRLSGEVRDAEGRPLPAVIYVDAHRLATTDRWDPDAPPGAIDIRGVPPGPHIVIVGASGHRGEVRRIVLGKDEHRTLTVTLPPRR